jgi:hypothetical protein
MWFCACLLLLSNIMKNCCLAKTNILNPRCQFTLYEFLDIISQIHKHQKNTTIIQLVIAYPKTNVMKSSPTATIPQPWFPAVKSPVSGTWPTAGCEIKKERTHWNDVNSFCVIWGSHMRSLCHYDYEFENTSPIISWGTAMRHQQFRCHTRFSYSIQVWCSKTHPQSFLRVQQCCQLQTLPKLLSLRHNDGHWNKQQSFVLKKRSSSRVQQRHTKYIVWFWQFGHVNHSDSIAGWTRIVRVRLLPAYRRNSVSSASVHNSI